MSNILVCVSSWLFKDVEQSEESCKVTLQMCIAKFSARRIIKSYF